MTKIIQFIKNTRYWYCPGWIALSYLGFVFFFAAIFFLAENTSQTSITLVQSFYFSVITQTTLGYGDIQPATEWARLLTALQALVGVAIIGIFLNALSHRHFELIDKHRSDKIKINFLKYYSEFRNIMFLRFVHVLPEHVKPSKEYIESFSKNGSKVFFYFNCHECNDDNIKYPIQHLDLYYHDNAKASEELSVELEIISQRLDYLLNNVIVGNSEALNHLFKHLLTFRRIDTPMNPQFRFSDKAYEKVLGILCWVDHNNELNKEYDPLVHDINAI